MTTSWLNCPSRTDGNASSFVVQPRLHHTNILDTIVRPGGLVSQSILYPTRTQRPSQLNPKSLQLGDAILIASFFDRASFDVGGYFRVSQHALLSSQTLEELISCNTCPLAYRSQPTSDTGNDDGLTNAPGPFGVPGCVVTIEGIAYCDGSGNPDYAE